MCNRKEHAGEQEPVPQAARGYRGPTVACKATQLQLDREHVKKSTR